VIRRIPPSTADGAKNVASLLLAHLAIVVLWAIVLSAPWGHWLAWLAPIACALHQKATSEWMHEAAHHNFVPSRAWNDRLIDALGCVLFFEDIQEHRRKHFRHHRGGGFFSGGDPDTAALAIRTRRDLLRGIAEDLCGVTALRAIADKASHDEPPASAHGGKRARRAVALSAVVYLALALLLAVALPGPAWLAVPVYLATLVTLYPLLNRMRVYSQHVELTEDGRAVVVGSHASRTIRPDGLGLLDRCLVSSRVMMFHAEHHEHPALPFRQLEQLAVAHDDRNRHARSRAALLRQVFAGLPA
jgi:fatty acid desaturase